MMIFFNTSSAIGGDILGKIYKQIGTGLTRKDNGATFGEDKLMLSEKKQFMVFEWLDFTQRRKNNISTPT